MEVNIPVYKNSRSQADANGEIDLYRESHRLNLACRNAVEKAIAQNYDGTRLNPDCLKDVINTYGAERISMLLANTIQQKDWDQRFSMSNRIWAEGISIPDDPAYGGHQRWREYEISTHSTILDGFVNLFRKETTLSHKTSVHESLKKPTAKNEKLVAPPKQKEAER